MLFHYINFEKQVFPLSDPLISFLFSSLARNCYTLERPLKRTKGYNFALLDMSKLA